MRVLNKTKNRIISSKAVLADSFFTRAKGLLGRTHLAVNEALIITRCQSIHMFFMKFSIDAVFVDRNNRVVGLVQRIKPNQLSPIFFKAMYVIELREGAIKDTNTQMGDEISLD